MTIDSVFCGWRSDKEVQWITPGAGLVSFCLISLKVS